MQDIQISESKPVWLTIGNTDNTEGRGRPIVLYVSESKETAMRLGEKRYVQGSHCPVEEAVAVKVGSRWLVPGQIQPESKQDADLRQRREKREAILERIKSAGFTEEEIKTLYPD